MTMENNNIKTCPNDCMKCSPQQRVYCAAYMSRMMLDRMQEQQEAFERLEKKVDQLASADDGIFNPIDEIEEAVLAGQEV